MGFIGIFGNTNTNQKPAQIKFIQNCFKEQNIIIGKLIFMICYIVTCNNNNNNNNDDDDDVYREDHPTHSEI